MNSPENQKSKRGIKIINELNQNINLKDTKDIDNIKQEKEEVNLQTANNNVKLLLTGFLHTLAQDESEDYKNILENFKNKINSNSITIDDTSPWEKNIKNSDISLNKKKGRKSKRKISLYTQMPKKFILNNKILENLKTDKQNIDINRTYSNISNNDLSNEGLVNKKKKSSNSISIINSLFKRPPPSPKRSTKNLSSFKNQIKSPFDNDYDNDDKIQKSNRTNKSNKTNKSNRSKFSQDKKSQKSRKSYQINKKGTLKSINKKKSSLFQLYKKPELFNNNNNNEDFNEIEFDKNSKRIAYVINSPLNSEITRTKNKISNTKISYKSQKGNSSLGSNICSTISNLDENLNSDSETELNIANIRGLSKRNVQEINDIRIKLKDNMIGKKNTKTNINKDLKKSKETSNQSTTRIKKKDKYRVLTRKKYVYDSLDDEEYDDEEEYSKVIKPDSKYLLILDLLISLCAIYDIFYIPYYLAHDRHFCGFTISNYHILIDFFITIIYFIDLFANFFIAYYDFEEYLIDELEQIAINYISSYFIFDLLASLPFKFYFIFKQYNCKNFTSNYYNVDINEYYFILISLRLLKVFKVYSKNKFVKECLNFLSHHHHFSQWGSLYLDIFVFFMGLHFVASLFIFIGRNQYPNWILKLELENSSFIHIYIASIYYLIATITTVGYGDITPTNKGERWFGLVLLIVGIIVYSFAVAGISNYIKEIDDKNADYEKKLKILEDIKITHHKINDDLYERICRYLKYKHFNEKKDKNIIIDCLPLGLRNILVYEMYKPIINNFIFFKSFDNNDFIVRVILAFKPILAMKNDILVKDGDFIEEIIFVKKGRLSLEIPIDLNNENNTHLLSLTAHNNTYKKDSTINNNSFCMSPSRKKNQQITSSINPYINKTSSKTFHLEDISPRPSPRKKRTAELKQREKEELEEKERQKNIQYLKILEIRKNEHFGDILMFLNRRSPLCAKVKSKKAEFFFLNKTDAVEISTCYPRIWNKINKKSLFNMEQIQRLINKVVKIFFAAHGIKNKEYVNPDPRFSTIVSVQENDESSSDLHSIPSISDSNLNNKVPSEGSLNSDNYSPSNIKYNKSLFGVVQEEENDDESSSKSSKYSKKNSSKKSEKINSELPIPKMSENNSNNDTINNNNSHNNSHNDDNKKSILKKTNINSLSEGKANDIGSDLISIRTYKMDQNDKSVLEFSDNCSIDDSILSYEKNYFSTNSYSRQTPFRPEDINEEIYPNENGLIGNLSHFRFIAIENNYSNINNKSNQIYAPKIFFPENYSFSHISGKLKSSFVSSNKVSEGDKKMNQIKKSDNSMSNISCSEKINNINISNKSNQNSNTKILNYNKTIIENNESENIFNNSKTFNKDIMKTVLINKSLRDLIDNSPTRTNNNLSVFSTESSFTIYSEYENINALSNYKYSKSVKLRNKIKKILKDDETSLNIKINKHIKRNSVLNNIVSPISLIEKENYSFSSRNNYNSANKEPTNKKSIRRRTLKSKSIINKKNNLKDKEKEIGEFVNNTPVLTSKKRISSKKSYGFSIFNNNKSNDKKANLLDEISQNIEKNQKNLNNPDEFYTEYFSNILTKNAGKISNCKSSFINNTIQKNNNNIFRRKSAVNINHLLKGISVDNIKRKNTNTGN